LIFHAVDKEAIKVLYPYLRYGDYIVSNGVNGDRRVVFVSPSGLEDVKPPFADDILSMAPSRDDILNMLSQGMDIRFLYMSHPSNAFYVSGKGDILRIDTMEPVCNIKTDGVPSREMVERVVSDGFFRNERCIFCEFYPLCGGHFADAPCEGLKDRFAELRRAVLRFRHHRSATVFVSFTCVNNCVFCAPADKRKERPLSKEEIINFIDDVSENGCISLSLSGAGEPTLNPDLTEIVRFAKSKGIPFISVQTNGHNLTPELLKDLVNSGVTHFLVSLHGNDISHDLNVGRKGSYPEAISAIERITAEGLPFTVNTCITKYNIDHLEWVLDKVKALNPGARHMLSFPEISGNAIKNLDVIPDMKEAAEAVMRAFSKGHRFLAEGLPLCLIKGFPRNMIIRSSITMYKDNKTDKWGSNNIYIDLCNRCPERRGCEGINGNYYRIKGAEHVKKEIGGKL